MHREYDDFNGVYVYLRSNRISLVSSLTCSIILLVEYFLIIECASISSIMKQFGSEYRAVSIFRWTPDYCILCLLCWSKYPDDIGNLNTRQVKVYFYPPASEASREVENLNWIKNPHPPVYGVKEFVCLSVCSEIRLQL